MQRYFWN